MVRRAQLGTFLLLILANGIGQVQANRFAVIPAVVGSIMGLIVLSVCLLFICCVIRQQNMRRGAMAGPGYPGNPGYPGYPPRGGGPTFVTTTSGYNYSTGYPPGSVQYPGHGAGVAFQHPHHHHSTGGGWSSGDGGWDGGDCGGGGWGGGGDSGGGGGGGGCDSGGGGGGCDSGGGGGGCD
ncbi:uncharacterized protein LOC143293117 isoform X3 [Babylonia areolata]|uniref:uncharacterized protein LOC143293117 isoform X3 n=1 Tax=Babylonia areolata TaxID=304850 RepID=UPI003FD51698